jgi:hypothetical protein
MALVTIMLAGTTGIATAAIKTQVVEYQQGNTTLEGYLAGDDATRGQWPGVLVIHEWMGLGDYAKTRARNLAELGYLALAADLHRPGVLRRTPPESAEEADKYRRDRKLRRSGGSSGAPCFWPSRCDQKRSSSPISPK